MKSLCLVITALLLLSVQTGCVYDPSRIVKLPKCGNGALEPGEQCDDGNTLDDDGCSSSCKVESGFRCANGTCESLCGDGRTTGSEGCDDGNMIDGDGCSAHCTIEPGASCSFGSDAKATCSSLRCGNGAVDSSLELCDDGNNTDGDGCSSCKVDPSWVCSGLIEDVNSPPDLAAIPIVFRAIGKDKFVLHPNSLLGGFGCPRTGSKDVLGHLVNGVPYVNAQNCNNTLFNSVFNTTSAQAMYTKFLPFRKMTKGSESYYSYKGEWNPFDRLADLHNPTIFPFEDSHYTTGVIRLIIDKSKVDPKQKFTISIADDLYVALNGKLVINQAGFNAKGHRTFSYSLNQAPESSSDYISLDIFLSKRNAGSEYLIELPTAIVGPSICRPDSNTCGNGVVEPIFTDGKLDIGKTLNACNDGDTDDTNVCSNSCTYNAGFKDCRINKNGGEIASTCKRI